MLGQGHGAPRLAVTEVVLAQMPHRVPESAHDHLKPQLPAAQPRIPRGFQQVFAANQAQFLGQLARDAPAVPGHGVGGLRAQFRVQRGRGVVDLGELRWRLAAADGAQPLHLLPPELGVVRDHRRRRPVFWAVFRAGVRFRGRVRFGEQLLLGGGRQSGQHCDGGAQAVVAGHGQSVGCSLGGLAAVKVSTSPTETVISAKPALCRRPISEAGSTGL